MRIIFLIFTICLFLVAETPTDDTAKAMQARISYLEQALSLTQQRCQAMQSFYQSDDALRNLKAPATPAPTPKPEGEPAAK
jgi:hypothetical protein